MENNAIILDYLNSGYLNNGSTFKKRPIAQAIGTKNFTLLELIPKENNDLELQERVYIGAGKRDKIGRVKGILDFEDLTATSKVEIDHAISEIITDHEDKYINWFNEAKPLSMRLHKLELLPGIGKKHMWDIIEAREEKPFESFNDLQKRVSSLSNPVVSIAKRIKLELDTTQPKRGKNKYRAFIQNPKKSKSKGSKRQKKFKTRRKK